MYSICRNISYIPHNKFESNMMDGFREIVKIKPETQHLNACVNADADAWASAIALWNQGPAELRMGSC